MELLPTGAASPRRIGPPSGAKAETALPLNEAPPNRSCVTNADCVSPGTCVTAATQDKRILANWGSNTNVTEDLRLTASSPLRDAGTYAGAPSTDLDGLPRPADGNLDGSLLPDIGAYEFRFSDSDGDGVADGSDCAPVVSSVWQVPGEVPSLAMALDRAQYRAEPVKLLGWL